MQVILETNKGAITIELDEAGAPKTVANFLQYVDDKHYEGAIFHRVIPGFMAQGGGYDASYEKKPVRTPVENEARISAKNLRGTVAMARTNDPHSATAQFFVNVSDNASLDHSAKNPQGFGYCVFGRVTSGMDVVDQIVAVRTGAQGTFTKDAPLEPIVIASARRL
ncbi:MAG TPA: peptidylprolyl isomerase [Polyangiaceae bacterium]|jgi:cyclophilin family peptidyl-prolyl cis-trans isomerase|nr:peptidylprolyl isomerase [Polyangiaceae bacterium]